MTIRGLTIVSLLAPLLVPLFVGTATAQTNNSYPMLMSLRPTAAVVGHTTEHELSARYNLAGASAVIVSGGGVAAEVVPLDSEKPEDRDKNDVAASKTRLLPHATNRMRGGSRTTLRCRLE